jgi:hypothetical protein
VYAGSSPGAGAAGAASYSEHKPKTPPPDLPSLLLDSRIVYLGMPVSGTSQPKKWLSLFVLARGAAAGRWRSLLARHMSGCAWRRTSAACVARRLLAPHHAPRAQP